MSVSRHGVGFNDRFNVSSKCARISLSQLVNAELVIELQLDTSRVAFKKSIGVQDFSESRAKDTEQAGRQFERNLLFENLALEARFSVNDGDRREFRPSRCFGLEPRQHNV